MMASEYPQRPVSHQLEDESERFFRQCLPGSWICERPTPDYGVDLRVRIVDGVAVTPRSFLVQLKASGDAPQGDTVSTVLGVRTHNFLWDQLEVALLVRYVAQEKEAYWILLKDVPPPDQNQETFTVHVPRANRISQQPWDQIAAYVADIHQRKLDATRRLRDSRC
jgi:hypothetical protein